MGCTLPSNFPFNEQLKYQRRNWHTNPAFGQAPEERTPKQLLNFGIINLDKPPNINSHQLAHYLKKLMGVTKIGHGGTLDPSVSGLLPIALEKATPITRIWLKSDKEYIGVMRIHEKIDQRELVSVVKEFEGTIYQKPPSSSSVKRRVRKRENYKVQILEMKERDVLLRIKCEAGMYIRKLFHDIGEAAGVGAHMVDLRRVKSGPFREDETLKTTQDVIDAWIFFKEEGKSKYIKEVLLPPERGVQELPRIVLDDGTVAAVTYGAPVYFPGIIALSPDINENDLVAAFSAKGELVALVNSRSTTKEVITNKEGRFSGKMRVLMEKGVYDPSWN